VRAHLEHDDWKREGEADAEPAGEIDELVVRDGLEADEHGFEGHAADRARAWAHLTHLRMHGAGVGRALGNGLGLGRGRRIEVAYRIGEELRPAACGAEVIRVALVLGPVLGRMRIDPHAAHRVLHAMFRLRMLFVAAMSCMVMSCMVMSRVVMRHLAVTGMAAAARARRATVLLVRAVDRLLVSHVGFPHADLLALSCTFPYW
jgi:hypothetical protein